MKHIIAIFGATLLIILMAATMGGITAFRSTTQTLQYDYTTGAGGTSANLTLPLAVLDDNLLHINSVTSNITADAPIAAVFIVGTKTLNVTGLNASDTRRLTVVYRTPSLVDYNSGVDLVAKWWPLFLVFGIIAVVVGAIVQSFQSK